MDINFAKRHLENLKETREQWGTLAMKSLTKERFDWASEKAERLNERIWELEGKIAQAEREHNV